MLLCNRSLRQTVTKTLHTTILYIRSNKTLSMNDGMGHGRHLAQGSKEPPPPDKDVLRVYSMKFCPYAQRLKLALAAKGIAHETVNINLVHKPDWFLAKNPRGLVPTIEINGKIVYESDITSEYVDSVFPGRKLITADPMKRAQEQMLLGDVGKMIRGFHIIISAQNMEKQARGFKNLSAGLESFDKHLGKMTTPYVCGDQPGFSDYMIWPHLERVNMMMEPAVSVLQNVQTYTESMKKDPAVIACTLSKELHMQFADGYRKKEICYDIGPVAEYNFDYKRKSSIKSVL